MYLKLVHQDSGGRMGKFEGPAWSNLTLHAFERKLPSLENTQHFAMPLVSTYVK